MKICLSCQKEFAGDSWRCPHCSWTPHFYETYPSFLDPRTVQDDSYPTTAYKRLHELEEASFWFQYRNSLIAMLISTYCPNTRSLLELGCGGGAVLRFLANTFPHMALYGADIHIEGLRYVTEMLPTVNCFQIDALNIPYRNEFDTIGLFDVLEHVDDDTRVLAEAAKALKEDGILIISVPQHPFLWSINDELACHKRRYTRPELAQKIGKAGYTILYLTSFVTFLFPLLLVVRSRLFPRKSSDDNPICQELNLHPALNRTLAAICLLESWFIKKGSTFALGGSLICIAKRNL